MLSTPLSCAVGTFYEKPWLKFERLLETYIAYAPKGIKSFITAMPIRIKEKLFLKDMIKKELAAIGDVSIRDLPELILTEHHMSHAAPAFFPALSDLLQCSAWMVWANGPQPPYGGATIINSYLNGKFISPIL